MKKKIFALVGIVIIATIAIFSSCNKEGNEIINGNVGAEVTQTKSATSTSSTSFYPHFFYRDNKYTGWCKESGSYVCGSDIYDPNNPFNNQHIMNGDEACLLMRYESHPDDLFGMYLPFGILYANNAGEIIDSAENGAMTFHKDFNIYSEKIMDFVGADLIPAGRYTATVTKYKGKDVVYIYFGKIK